MSNAPGPKESQPGVAASDDHLSLIPAPVQVNPGPTYAFAQRKWQGIPTTERTKEGRLWAAWYSGGDDEGPENYVLAVTSDDDGVTWTDARLVVDPPGMVRAFDPCLWRDPLDRLWLFWAQSLGHVDGRFGVCCARCDDPDADEPQWTPSVRIGNGIMLNKPMVLSNGAWLAPAAVWASMGPFRPDMAQERFSNVLCSHDQGESWTLLGGADIPDRQFDEHMIVERRDGSLWMLVRTFYGIGESVSTDGGKTWSPGRDSQLGGPSSRFFIRRLRSGSLLLVNHYQFTKRDHLTAMISDDDGATWRGHLLLDERDRVSYPDGVEGEDGTIYLIYDRDRLGHKEILLATFTEADVRAGEIVTPTARLKQVLSGRVINP